MASVYINQRTSGNNFIAAGSDANGTIYREPKPQELTELKWTSIVTNSDGNFILPVKDHKTIILVKSAEASDAKTVTFKAGNGYHAGDYQVSVAAGKEYFVTLDSANFADKENGYIEVTTNETTANKIYVAVLEVR